MHFLQGKVFLKNTYNYREKYCSKGVINYMLFRFSRLIRDRSKDTFLIKKALPTLSFQLMGKKTYFPIMFLMEAITAYEFGFDLAAIFYAALSFEMALLIKVDEKIGDIKDEEKRKLKKLKNLIEKAYELQIIDEKHKAIAHTMRKLRNCYIHYYNAIHYLPVSSIPPKVIEKLKTFIEKNQKLMRAFESIDQKAIEITEVLKKGKPVCSWSISPEAIEFMKERYEESMSMFM